VPVAEPSLPYLGAGFGIAWVALAVYFVRLARAQRNIDRRLDHLRGKDEEDRAP